MSGLLYCLFENRRSVEYLDPRKKQWEPRGDFHPVLDFAEAHEDDSAKCEPIRTRGLSSGYCSKIEYKDWSESHGKRGRNERPHWYRDDHEAW